MILAEVGLRKSEKKNFREENWKEYQKFFLKDLKNSLHSLS